jgi:hypothetical protein
VRAFGCLLEELLARTDLAHPSTNSTHAQQQQILQALQIACMHTSPSQRPLFVHITHTLNPLVSV